MASELEKPLPHLSRKNREVIWVRIALKTELVHKFVNSNSAIGRKG